MSTNPITPNHMSIYWHDYTAHAKNIPAIQSGLSECVHINQILHRENILPEVSFLLLNIQAYITPHHKAGNLLFIQGGNLVSSHGLSVPENGHPVTESFYLIQLMGNEDNGVTVFPQKL